MDNPNKVDMFLKMTNLLVHFRYQLNFIIRHLKDSRFKFHHLNNLLADSEFCSNEYLNLINSNHSLFENIRMLEQNYLEHMGSYSSFKSIFNDKGDCIEDVPADQSDDHSDTEEKPPIMVCLSEINDPDNANDLANEDSSTAYSTLMIQNRSNYLIDNNCDDNIIMPSDEDEPTSFGTLADNLHLEYFCSFLNCRYRAATLAAVKTHEQRRHLNQIRKCCYDGCEEIFQSKEDLDSHMSRDHLNAKLKCTFENCEQEFRNEYRLRLHIKESHKPEKENEFVCKNCKKIFRTRKLLSRHIKRMHGPGESRKKTKKLKKISKPKSDSDETEAEDECEDQPEKTQKDNQDESRSSEGDDGVTRVKEEQESMETSIHIDNPSPTPLLKKPKKTEPIKFDCTIAGCSEKFLEKSKLNQHIREKHRAEYLTCKFCDKLCRTRNNLTNHIWLYHEEGEFACDRENCDFTSKFRNDLKNHRKNRHGTSRTCPICGETIHGSRYRRHLTNFHMIKRQACSWPDCGKTFADHSSLKNHVRIHLNFKRFKCKWAGCNYASEQRFSVITHIRVCHFKLPRTKKKQQELNIMLDDSRNPYDYLEICREDICI